MNKLHTVLLFNVLYYRVKDFCTGANIIWGRTVLRGGIVVGGGGETEGKKTRVENTSWKGSSSLLYPHITPVDAVKDDGRSLNL